MAASGPVVMPVFSVRMEISSIMPMSRATATEIAVMVML